MNRSKRTNKLIVLGIDGMDSSITKKLLDEGKLPNIKKYIERGASRSDLSMLGAHPTITPPCWTTLATGAYPGTHGITCYWRQSPDSLDAVVYNMDSRNCLAEQIWNQTVKSGLKTLVWHWPGSSWPPTSDSPDLAVVDGTQPGSVNMGIAQMDWEKIVYASVHEPKLRFVSHTHKAAGVGCNITDIGEVLGGGDDEEDEMMELWWGDAARATGCEIRTYVQSLDDTEMMIGAKVAYDIVASPIAEPTGWENYDTNGAKEFTILISAGKEERYGLVLFDENQHADRVALFRSKADAEPFTVVRTGEMVTGVIDTATKNGKTKPCCRSYKLLDLAEDGSEFRLWISNALDQTNNVLWYPQSVHNDILDGIGYIPPVSLIGGEDFELARDVFMPSWEKYNDWQADCISYLIDNKGYDVVFSHLHNVDCAGHQFWHLCKTLEPWSYIRENKYQKLLEEVYLQTDEYLGRFLHYLDEGFTILIVSDHGLLVGENVPPLLGEYGGLNVPVMEELGYTVMKKDADGNSTGEVDWEKTTAVQIRSNYIYLNLKGRDKTGIVDPKDQYDLEEKIISDLYNYRDPETGKRVVGIALRNKDAVIIGCNGPECGDIFFSVEEGFNRLHGDGLTTAKGYYNTSTTPVFIAAGEGVSEHVTTDRVIRQIDVAPTVAFLLGTNVPAQCEGAPIYQIFKEDI